MHPLFDSIILGFLVLDGVLILFLIFRIRKSKRHHKAVPFSAKGALVLGTIAWVVFFYGSFIEPRFIVIQQRKILLDGEQKAIFRIALVSDLHLGIYKKMAWAEKVVSTINALSPDIVILAGDFLHGEEADPEYLRPLKNLRSKYGNFAVLGNHDYEEDFELEPNFSYEGNERVLRVVQILSEAGVKILRNESISIKINDGQSLLLGGVDELWTARADVRKTFGNYLPARSGAEPTVLVAHNPDIIDEALKAGIDLVLAGHTHGGQIRLPFFGSVSKPPTELGKQHDRGLFSFGKTQLFITTGAGESGPRARLLVPPEIALLEVYF